VIVMHVFRITPEKTRSQREIGPKYQQLATENVIFSSKKIKHTETKQCKPSLGNETHFKYTGKVIGRRNETQVDTMRAGLAITQVETIRNRADDHRDRKCRETDDTRDVDFKIRHKNSGS